MVFIKEKTKKNIADERRRKQANINYQEYIEYFKNLKLGVQKGCKFLRELELRIENLKSLKKTKHKYYNPDTKNLWYFEESKIPQIRKIIQNLMFEFYIEFNITTDNFSVFEHMIHFHFSESCNLNSILNVITQDINVKINILYKLLILCFKKAKKSSLQKNELVSLFSFELERFLKYSKVINSKINFSNLSQELVFSFGREEISISDFEFENTISDLEMPNIFSLNKNKYKISLKHYYLFLLDLDIHRISIDSLRLAKYYQGIDITRIKKLCLRTNKHSLWERINYYLCDFLGFDNFALNFGDYDNQEYVLGFFFEIKDNLYHLYYYKYLLQEKIYRNLVLSCFSDFELCNEKFFSKKDKWIKKK